MPTCCVTGHRTIPAEQREAVAAALEAEIDRAIADGYTSFISGFAEGVDQMFAAIVMRKRRQHPTLRLEAALPYRQRFYRLAQNPDTHDLLFDGCTEFAILSDEYNGGVFSKRNRYMVNKSQRVIAVYDGRSGGGTASTITYARSLQRELRMIALR